MNILRVSAIVVSVLLTAVTVLAQSASELRTKYGPPMDAYEVRPNLLVTVKYSKDGEVVEYVIEARHTSRNSVTYESLISGKTAREIIDELAPMSQRGAYQSTGSFNSSCNELSFETYERVKIQTFTTCPAPSTRGIVSVVIRWRYLEPKGRRVFEKPVWFR